jgi:hypothetical protein
MDIVTASPRFGILLGSMVVSIIFIVVDVLAVTPAIPIGVINPFWKFAFIFKCLTDTIILDDFKTALDKLRRRRMAGVYPLNGVPGQPHWTFGNLEAERQTTRSKTRKEEPSVLLVENSETQGNREGDSTEGIVEHPPRTWPSSTAEEWA